MRRSWWAVVLAGMLAVSCSTDGSTDMVFDPDPDDDDNGEEVTFTFVQESVFSASCSCHMAGQFPNLGAGRAYAAIVGVAGSSGQSLVAPGNPDGSYLYRKIAGSAGITGARMPFGGPYLTAGQIDAVEAWIQRGAPND